MKKEKKGGGGGGTKEMKKNTFVGKKEKGKRKEKGSDSQYSDGWKSIGQ